MPDHLIDGSMYAIKARLRRGCLLRIALEGHCMEPLLFAGDEVSIVRRGSYSEGSICLISLPNGSLALHRIIWLRSAGAVTKGDLAGREESIALSEVLGTVVSVKPHGSGEEIALSQNAFFRRIALFLSRVLSSDFKESRCEWFAKVRPLCKKVSILYLSTLRRLNLFV